MFKIHFYAFFLFKLVVYTNLLIAKCLSILNKCGVRIHTLIICILRCGMIENGTCNALSH